MKNKFLFIAILGLTAILFIVPCLNKENPNSKLSNYEEYLEKTFYSKEKKYLENKKQVELKADRPDLAFEQDFRITMDPFLKRPATERLAIARQQIRNQQRGNATMMAPLWNERGPNNVGGRTRCLVYDPNDITNKKIWAGAVGGGLWYCEDITLTNPAWNRVNDFWNNIAISTICFDPTNSQLIYVGTGEGWSNLDAQRGAGIWKSSDGGANWQQLSSTMTSTYYHIQKIVINTTGLYVGTKANGVMRSTDGGITFSKVLGSSTPVGAINQVSDLEIGADGTIYAGLGIFSSGSIWKSKLGTAGTWTKINTGSNGMPTTGFERVEIAVAPSDSNVLYALTQDESTNGLFDIYYSANKGLTWTTCAKPDDADSGIPTDDFSRGQAWYDLIAAVDPLNANTIIVGGVDLFKSTNAGTSWNQIAHWYGGFGFPNVHADQHAIAYKKNSSSELLFGNDGGIFRTVNATSSTPTFTKKNTGYNVTQFYSCAMSPTSGSSVFLAGAQDNGTQRFSTANINATVQVNGGDGAFCFIDQDNPNIAIASYVYNNFYLSTNGGSNFSSTLSSSSTTGSFINPADYDDRENILYSAYSSTQIQRITNVTGTPITTQLTIPSLGARVSHISVSPFSTIGTSTIFIGTEAGKTFKIENAQSASPTIISLGSTLSGSVSCIEIGESENELLFTLSNYGVTSVYYSSNAGQTKISKEGNLPDMPVRWALFNPLNRSEVMLATELGVWFTATLNNTSPTWVASNSGLATTRIDMLQYRSSDNLVIAATHGRGLFSCSNFTSNITAVPTADFTSSKTTACLGETISFADISTNSPIAWSWTFNGGTAFSSTSSNPQIKYDTLGTFNVTLVATNILGASTPTIKTGYITIVNPPALAIITGLSETCINDTTSYVSVSKETSYAWVVTGGKVLSGQNTDSITLVWNSTGNKNISLRLTNANGCQSSIKNFPVIIHDQLSVSTISGSTSNCVLDTFNYSAVTTNATNLLWNVVGGNIIGNQDSSTVKIIWNQVSNQNSISLTASSFAGCEVVNKQLSVVTTTRPVALFNSDVDTTNIAFGGVVHFQNNALNAINYLWDFGDSSATSTDTNPIHVYLKTGKFVVSLTASNTDCSSTATKEIIAISTVGASIKKLQKRISVNPNPSIANVTISLDGLHFNKVELISMQGKVLKASLENTISVEGLANGNYLLRIYTNEGIVEKKIIKN